MEPTKSQVSRVVQSSVASPLVTTQIVSGHLLASLPPTATPKPDETLTANAVAQCRENEKSNPLVELSNQIRVLQAQLDVLKKSHSALSTRLINQYKKAWEGMTQDLWEEVATLRRDVNSFLEDLTGYPDFRKSVDNTFRTSLERLETLDATLQGKV